MVAALFGAAMVPLTVAGILGVIETPEAFGPYSWHAHELMFGYAAAVIAGFLLTAVANWTGLPPTDGKALVALVALWAAGRIAVWYADSLPGLLVAAVDLAFLPVLAIVVGAKIVRARNFRNLIVVVILTVLMVSNFALHMEVLGLNAHIPDRPILLTLGVLMFLLALIGGRVIPFFTGNALPDAKVRQMGRLDMAAVILLLPVMMPGLGAMAPWLFGVAALAHLARMIGWRSFATFGNPLLLILHVGYLWIVVSLALRALGAEAAGIHALTVGALGSLTIGMMSRTVLGHTGRALKASRMTIAAYVLVNLAALLRVGAALQGGPADNLVWAAATLWSLALVAYLIDYAPMLVMPRPGPRPRDKPA